MGENTECEVYRRRKSRNESTDKNRIIGGIGRRRLNQNSNSIQERINHFGPANTSEKTNLQNSVNNNEINKENATLPRRQVTTNKTSNKDLTNNSEQITRPQSSQSLTQPSPSLTRRRNPNNKVILTNSHSNGSSPADDSSQSEKSKTIQTYSRRRPNNELNSSRPRPSNETPSNKEIPSYATLPRRRIPIKQNNNERDIPQSGSETSQDSQSKAKEPIIYKRSTSLLRHRRRSDDDENTETKVNSNNNNSSGTPSRLKAFERNTTKSDAKKDDQLQDVSKGAQKRLAYKHSDSISKISAIKSRLYEQQSNDSSGSDSKYRARKTDSKQTIVDKSQNNSKLSKIPLSSRNNSDKEVTDLPISKIDTCDRHVETRRYNSSRTLAKAVRETLDKSSFTNSTSESFEQELSENDNVQKSLETRNTSKKLTSEKNILSQNRNTTPVTSEQSILSKECAMSGLASIQNNVKSKNELEKSMKVIAKGLETEKHSYRESLSEINTKKYKKSEENINRIVDSNKATMTHMTGVCNNQNKTHAEKDFTKISDSQDKKRHMNTNFVETESQNTITRNNISKKDNVTDKLTNEEVAHKKTHSDSNQKNFPKIVSENRFNRCSNRDKWATTTTSDTDNEIPSSHSSDSKHQKKASESTDTTEEEKVEPSKRKRLKKKRSKRSKVKPIVVPRKIQQKSFDTSDGDILESNYTSDDFEKRGNDSEIISDNDDVVVDTQNNLTAKLNSENLTSQLSEHKNNRTFNSIYHRKDVIEFSKSQQQYPLQSSNAGKMKSSSLTVVTMPKFNSFSNQEVTTGSRSEDEGAKLASWKDHRDGPLGSFHSISRVSAIKLGSFAGLSTFSPVAKRRSFSTDGKSKPTSSYTEISDTKLDMKNPFSLKSLNNNYSGRHSDGEHEITSRMEKMNEELNDGLHRSYTLPRNTRFKNLSKTPFSLMPEQTQAEREESARVAEVLDSLPDSPFSLIGRFTRDTERLIQSRAAAGNLDRNIDTDMTLDDEDDTLKLEKTETDNLNIEKELESSNHLSQDIKNNNDINKNKNDFSNLPKPASKVRARPQLPISSLSTENDDEFSKQSIDNPGPLRRPSYMIAQSSDDMIDPISSIFGQTDEPISPKADDNDLSKKTIWSRPRIPGTLTAQEINSGTDQVLTSGGEQKTGSDSDAEDIFPPDVNILAKTDALGKGRTRPPLALAPLLAGIPEERSNHKSIDELGRSRKHRKPNLIPFPEDTIAEEPTREPDCDSPKTDERETGYHSQGSDLLSSTPNKLSCEDLFSEQDIEKYEDTQELDNETKDQSNSPSTSIAVTPTTPDFNKLHKRDSNFSGTSSMLTSASDTNITKQSTNEIKGKATLSTTSLQANIGKINTDTSKSTVSLPIGNEKPAFKYRPEMREHVLQNLLETERSYVSNLRTMINMFFKPLKLPENANIIEPTLVDEIFYQIPEILKYHELFLEQLTERSDSWSDTQVIGDVFVSSFSKCLLMDAYSGFISHFVQAKDAIRQATNARPQFNKYIEQCYKEHREKLTLADLLINPVQRIPRYKLLLKDMLKYTPIDHPDFGSLQLALGEVETLADRMNKGELEADQAERDIEKLRETESTIEGITDLVTTTRKYIRQDLVAEMNKGITKKDRCLFLFSDLLVCTTVRRRTNALRRGSLGLFTGTSAADLNRYKFVWKLPLDNVEITKASNSQANGNNKDIERLEEDLTILSKMSNQMGKLSVPHMNIESSIRDVAAEVRNLIHEKQAQLSQALTLSPMLSKIELLVQLDERNEVYAFMFLSAECKSSWQAFFEDAKQKLSSSKGTFPPEFQYPKPITKTRSGMQFTCAAPSHIANFPSDGLINNTKATGDIWICSSDGYAGEVCLLSMIPVVEAKATLSVGSSRIVCVSAVPGANLTGSRSTNNNNDIMRGNMSRSPPRKVKNSKLSSSLRSKKSNLSDDDDGVGHAAESIIAFDSSDDEPENDYGTPFLSSSAFGGRMSPDGSSLGTVESIEGRDNSDFSSSDDDQVDSSHPLHNYNNSYMDDYIPPKLDRQPTMWLGTEDRRLYVYRSHDAVNQRKSKTKIHLSAPATAILYFENKVIVALASGELCIYQRDADTNSWDMSSPQKIHVSISGAPIVCVTAVAGRIWCGCQNTIVLVNATSLKIETTFSVSDDNNRTVHRIVNSGLGVWVSLQGSSLVKLYHATTFEYLSKIDVAPAVQKMLAGADAIIRQHKAACLRVTALLVCKDLLWIGTSAGVILTNPLPSITASTSPSSASGLGNSSGLTGSPHGHTGHVRFLSSVDVPESEFKLLQNDNSSPFNNRYKIVNDYQRNKNSTDNNGVPMLTLVVSGGDGYEDFRSNQQNDTIGRDDSTNHLLIWRV